MDLEEEAKSDEEEEEEEVCVQSSDKWPFGLPSWDQTSVNLIWLSFIPFLENGNSYKQFFWKKTFYIFSTWICPLLPVYSVSSNLYNMS